MTRIQIKSRVGPDGVLALKVPVGAEEANREVVVTVQPAEEKPKMAREEWLRFIEETAGSIDDPTFVRPDQGEFEERNPVPAARAVDSGRSMP